MEMFSEEIQNMMANFIILHHILDKWCIYRKAGIIYKCDIISASPLEDTEHSNIAEASFKLEIAF
jgi:hypothetical protein